MRDALVDIAEKLLVDEILPQEPFFRAARLRRITNGRENMPGRRDQEEKDTARKQSHLAEILQIAQEQQEQENNCRDEQNANQALCKDVECRRCRKPPAHPARGSSLLVAQEKKIKAGRKP